MYPIRDYFLIGDLHTAALVSQRGSIDWLCLPHFDSPSIFAALLDPQGGTFAVEMPEFSVESRYRSDTAIVEYAFQGTDNRFDMYDFMVPQPVQTCDSHFLVRKVVGRKGTVRLTLRFNPRPNYARGALTRINTTASSVLHFSDKKDSFFLHIPDGAEITPAKEGYIIKYSLAEGKEARFVLEYGKKQDIHWKHESFEHHTEEFWRRWVSQGRFFEFCRDELVRSAVTLKLMQFYPTGAIIAAPTTSLPEELGGVRNWDYRYVWVRDATFTLYALYVLGYTEEAIKFFEFIERISKECEECDINVHLMYTILGAPVPREEQLSHFAGYQNSQPVRVGNDARDQFQLDIYGSLIDAHYFMAQRGVRLTEQSKQIILAMLEKIKTCWREPDNGIWEMRSKRQHFTYSKVMAWVGINRGRKLCDDLGVSQEKQQEMRILEEEIKQWIWDYCIDEERHVIRQHPNTPFQDATNFLLVALKFLDKHDPRTKQLIENTAQELVKERVFVDRYHTEDGLSGDEGAFVLSTYWYLSALLILGDVEKARELFDMFTSYINRIGLLSEEIDERTGEYLGNYPQAFSHMGYVMTAYYLQKYYYNNLNKKKPHKAAYKKREDGG